MQNDRLYQEYIKQKAQIKKRGPGRPVTVGHAPGTQRLLPGEKKQSITTTQERHDAMIAIARARSISLKDAYTHAVEQFIAKNK